MLASPQSLRNAKWQRGKEATGDLIINVQAFLDLCNDVSLHTLKFECNQKVLLLSKHFLMGIYSDLGLFGRGGGGGICISKSFGSTTGWSFASQYLQP